MDIIIDTLLETGIGAIILGIILIIAILIKFFDNDSQN